MTEEAGIILNRSIFVISNIVVISIYLYFFFRARKNKNIIRNFDDKIKKLGINKECNEILYGYINAVLEENRERDKDFESISLTQKWNFNMISLAMLFFTFIIKNNLRFDMANHYLTIEPENELDNHLARLIKQINLLKDDFIEEEVLFILASDERNLKFTDKIETVCDLVDYCKNELMLFEVY